MNKTTKSEQITDEQFNYIIAEIAKTAGENVGNNFLKLVCNNSFADKL